MHKNLIANNLQLNYRSVSNTVDLLSEGATIPFIARYRKEATGSLDEVNIADIQKEFKRLQDVEKRKETILKAIKEQGKLSDFLQKKIIETWDLIILEDLYLPYKRKRKTRGASAIESGFEPLAKIIFEQKNLHDLDLLAEDFVTVPIKDVENVLNGARDIIAEWINEDGKARDRIRFWFKRGATIRSKVARNKEEVGAKYRDYFDFEEDLKKCPSHRILAIRRGEEEGFLRVSIQPKEEDVLSALERMFVTNRGPASDHVKEAIADCYKRLLGVSIETEFRKISKEKADAEAINVFAENLRQLMLSPPLGQKAVMGIDPGFKSGCKVVCLDKSGKLLYETVVYPHPPQKSTLATKEKLLALADKYQIEAIAVGNGTAGRETMALCNSIRFMQPTEVFMVNESGASIYSASAIAREEFPDEDITVRGAVSIARRLMDPLAELVKIDAKSIGVGQYQHDVNQPQLKESLDRVVESCVNAVGTNLNTASKHLLTYISGLGPTLAQNIVNYREENGAFINRKDLKKVARMGPKVYEQCAGFLRIRNAKNPLDNTAVHPESYAIVKKMASDLNCTVKDLIQDKTLRQQINPRKYITTTTGLPTLQDIISELAKPGLDPRGNAKSFQFAAHIKSIEDLEIGMIIPGIVNNITNFGAFVDIGIKAGGLVHISKLANRFIKSPSEVVSLQQEVTVKVMDIDLDRNRVQLSIKDV